MNWGGVSANFWGWTKVRDVGDGRRCAPLLLLRMIRRGRGWRPRRGVDGDGRGAGGIFVGVLPFHRGDGEPIGDPTGARPVAGSNAAPGEEEGDGGELGWLGEGTGLTRHGEFHEAWRRPRPIRHAPEWGLRALGRCNTRSAQMAVHRHPPNTFEHVWNASRRWSDGVMECWSDGVLECWSVGVLDAGPF